MAESATPAPTVHPGPTWMWFTAWSLQGMGFLAASQVGVEGEAARFLLIGGIAAVPLIALNVVLRRRGTEPSTSGNSQQIG